MRGVIMGAAVVALLGCGEANKTPAAAPPSPPTATSALPAGFPQADQTGQGADCIVYLSLSIQAKTTPAGRDAPIMQQSSDQWRASIKYDEKLSDAEIQQLVASTVNPLMATPAAQRDAASAWCVDNAPEPDPSN